MGTDSLTGMTMLTSVSKALVREGVSLPATSIRLFDEHGNLRERREFCSAIATRT